MSTDVSSGSTLECICPTWICQLRPHLGSSYDIPLGVEILETYFHGLGEKQRK